MRRRPILLLGAVFATGALLMGACTDDSGSAKDDNTTTTDSASKLDAEQAKAVAEHYADGVYATYQASIASATTLNDALKAFTANPTDETLKAAKDQWLTARDDYLVTEAYRFYDGPIDNPDNGPEGQINAWPMDENYVDYVEGDSNAGIINNVDEYPEITEAVLVDANENGGETNISTGWHAIEFLLWGQDLSETGPGNRPVTDYTTAANAERRATYLNLLGDLLVKDLKFVGDQWDPAGTDNYRTEFLADPDQAIADMFRGVGALTVGELSGERIAVAIETKDQEDEHSCFSDNTDADIVGDIAGIQNVLLGTYPNVDDGPGLNSLIESADSETASKLAAQIEKSLSLAEGLTATFDEMLRTDTAPLQAIVDSLTQQGQLIASGAKDLGIEVDTGV